MNMQMRAGVWPPLLAFCFPASALPVVTASSFSGSPPAFTRVLGPPSR